MKVQPKLLFVTIPEVPEGAPFQFHPISRSQQPQRYGLADLSDSGEARTDWLTFFEETLVGLYWKTGHPIPYVFRTADGTVRSLDAGCIKWMHNREPPEIRLHFDASGVIDSVTPSPELQQRHEWQRESLVARLSGKRGAAG